MRYIHRIFSYPLSKRRCPVVCLPVILPRVLVTWTPASIYYTTERKQVCPQWFSWNEGVFPFCGGTVEPRPPPRGTYRICAQVCEPRADACRDLSQRSDSPRAPTLSACHVSSPCLVAACSAPSSGFWCDLLVSSSCWSVSKGCLQSCTARGGLVPIGGSPRTQCVPHSQW